MSHTVGVRQAQKQKTRQALLDAGLRLLEEQSLSSLGLREVTRLVGVAPAAFYRHFRDMADLGVALVEEALGSLHGMIRAILAEQDGDEERIEGTVDAVAQHVRAYPAHVRFIARERHGGVRPVREAIAAELGRFVDEVAAAFAVQLVADGWSAEDIRMLAELYVDHMVMTAAAFLEAAPDRTAAADTVSTAEGSAAVDAEAADRAAAEVEARIAATACSQLRIISLGRRHWRDA
ncbi:TetR family transcriptional regulator [Streptomyces zagrosensis]|uniref:AcrR family transcriptional regulator n=1 Tax=Streptomyces zagrosensis TaxID=1042984 RepID=A0A7W9QGH5_9ACTN|nr:TetR family transcriptional regulator [Streptomyces zagrosensis]MBB5939830.1 AcrR family transcriptional regulator [Streptomyces zagrosensis]